MGVHIIILYASERKIAAEVKAFAAESRRIWSRGCKEKHPTMLKIATDDAKISCRNAVASYICIANCAILFALDVVLRRPETSATKGDGGRNLIGLRTKSDRTADGIRSDGGRNPIGRRTESDRTADGNHHK